jgi:ferredoxin-thioredoxin reductase catalytic subunit
MTEIFYTVYEGEIHPKVLKCHCERFLKDTCLQKHSIPKKGIEIYHHLD